MSVLCEEGLERFWTDAKTYLTGTAVPLMDGTAAVGSSSKFAREDHVHPSDSTKVDKVAGMGLSTNDFTDALKQKLEGLVSYSTMTAAEMEAGTDTTGKLVTAKDLHDTYVNVSGDTMTGALIMNNANIDVRSSSLTVGSTPSANTYGRQIFLRDSVGTTIGYLQSWINTSGNTYINLNTYRNVNGTDTYNGITLGISPTGERLVSVSAPAAWRTALDVYSKTESDNRFVNVTGDTMTGTLTLRSGNTSTNLVFDNSAYTDTISQKISGGIRVTVSGSFELYSGSTRHYYLVTNESYYHHFATTVRFHDVVLHDKVTYHSDSVFVDGHSVYADSNNLTTGTAISSTVHGTGGYYGRDSNNNYIGGVRFVGYDSNRYGVNLFAENGSTYNQLSLLVSNSGTRSVWMTDPSIWRVAIGMGYYWSYNANIGEKTGTGATVTQTWTGSSITMPAGTYFVAFSIPLHTSRNTSGGHLRIGTTDLCVCSTNSQPPSDTQGISIQTVYNIVTLSSAITGKINIACNGQDANTTWRIIGYNRTSYYIMKIY